MGRDFFDPNRLRKRWAPEPPKPRGGGAAPGGSAVSHPKLAEVVTPVDSLAVAQTLLTEIRERVRRELPEHRELLTPFFEQAERELATLVEAPEGTDLDEVAAAALTTLDRLEDLLEAYYFLIPRVR